MTCNFLNHKLSISQAVNTFKYIGDTPSSSYISRSLQALSTKSPSQRLPKKLGFLKLNKEDEHNTYNEDILTYLHYSIKWKVYINKKVIFIDMG